MKGNDRQPNIQYQFLLGILLGIALHFAFALIWFVIAFVMMSTIGYFQTNYNFFFLALPLACLAITQVIYLLPAYIIVVRKNWPEMAKGIVACAIVTILLNSACFGGLAGMTGIWILGASTILAIISGFVAHWFTKRSR